MTFCKHELSVVIISRNEEKNITKCIESVLKATEDIDACEIVLVDSASTDRTVEFAANYSIRILQLDSSWPLSPGAGFYVGFLNTSGKYIQFQCGDTILDENWFKNASPVLKKNKQVGGVAGTITQQPYNTRFAKKYMDSLNNLPAGEIKWFAGDILFKREVLHDVGSFNPYLLAGEEGELSCRIITNGYKLLRLPYHMSHHVGCAEENYYNYLKKTFRYSVAQGQILRYSLDNKQIFRLRLWEYRFKLISICLIFSGVISGVVFFTSGITLLLYLWMGGVIFYTGWVLFEVRNIKNAIFHTASQIIKSIPLVWGFLKPKKNPTTYPSDIKLIK